MTRPRAPGPSTPSTVTSAPTRARSKEPTSRARTAAVPVSPPPRPGWSATTASVDGESEQYPVATGHRGRLVHQGPVRPPGPGVGTDHGVLGPVLSHRAAVVGQAGLDPLDAVDVRSLPGHGRQDPGPRRDAGVLVVWTEEGEAVAPYGQHRRGRTGRTVDDHPHHRRGDSASPTGTPISDSPSKARRLPPARRPAAAAGTTVAASGSGPSRSTVAR